MKFKGPAIAYNESAKEQHKWFCNECVTFWFSTAAFEDLCPTCESERIFSYKVTMKDKEKIKKKLKKAAKLKRKVDRLLSETEEVSWVKPEWAQ